ncbi:MAG: hypothetical protein OIF57_15970 [Marinobacterium sp.]|nr:hypothetical protein [Marinobacterium sp.]
MKTTYRVKRGFRVGESQRWLMPGDEVELLPVEAQYPLSRGWIESVPVNTKAPADKPAGKAED